MTFPVDTLKQALVEAALVALDRAGPIPIRYVALALSEDTLLPQALVTAPGVALPLDLPEPAEPEMAELARATGLSEETLDLEGGVGRDLLLVALIEAAEGIAQALQERGLTPRRVPAGFQEPGEVDLLDSDAAEVLWEDLTDGLKRLPAAAKALIAQYFFEQEPERERFLRALG